MRALVFVALLCVGNAAGAATIFSYIGNAYTSTSNIGDPTDKEYELTMNVVGSITFAGPVEVFPGSNIVNNSGLTSYSFFDGINTLTEANSIAEIRLYLDEEGLIDEWAVSLTQTIYVENQPDVESAVYQISTRHTGPDWFDTVRTFECTPIYHATEDYWGCTHPVVRTEGRVSTSGGQWSRSSVVPIPAAAWLFGSALAGMCWLRRKQIN